MVTKIQAYQTTDGKLFDHKKDAERHQAYLDFVLWAEDHLLELNDYTDKCDGEMLAPWLLENKDEVIKFLSKQ